LHQQHGNSSAARQHALDDANNVQCSISVHAEFACTICMLRILARRPHWASASQLSPALLT
jgi:hypothetical protein